MTVFALCRKLLVPFFQKQQKRFTLNTIALQAFKPKENCGKLMLVRKTKMSKQTCLCNLPLFEIVSESNSQFSAGSILKSSNFKITVSLSPACTKMRLCSSGNLYGSIRLKMLCILFANDYVVHQTIVSGMR